MEEKGQGGDTAERMPRFWLEPLQEQGCPLLRWMLWAFTKEALVKFLHHACHRLSTR